jgi:hypothetical protein
MVLPHYLSHHETWRTPTCFIFAWKEVLVAIATTCTDRLRSGESKKMKNERDGFCLLPYKTAL